MAAFDPATNESFFEREKERLIEEISSVSAVSTWKVSAKFRRRQGAANQRCLIDLQNFEEVMTHTNVLNRKLEEVYGVGKEFKTVAALWGKFNEFIRNQQVCLMYPFARSRVMADDAD